ncbi:hypothetical protein Tco_1288613 [Tanacetum coccineum]
MFDESKFEPARRRTSSRRISKKKVSIFANDNIIHEPYVALELPKSMSLTEAAEEEVTRKVHATHERIVTESNPKHARRRPSGIAFRDTSSMSKKISPDPSQKLKGIQTLTADEQLDADTMQALKASKKSSRSHSHIGGSSEGTGFIPGVPDESTVIIATSSEGTEENEYSEEENVDEEIAWVSTGEDEEKKEDDDVDDDKSVDIEETGDEETDDGRVHGVEYVQDDVDEEMKDVKVADTGKGKEEISDAAKAYAENTKEVKDDQIKDDSAQDNQATVFAFTTQKSSSLSVLSGFGNQFINLSSDTYLIAAPTATIVPDPLLAIVQRVSKLEKDVQELKQVDRSSLILATIRSQVPAAVDKYLGSNQGGPEKQQMPKYSIKLSDEATLDGYDQKSTIFQTMTKSKSFNKHPAHKALYYALIDSLLADEEAIDQGVKSQLLNLQKRVPRNDWFTQSPRPPTLDPKWNKGKEVDNGQEQTWFNDMLSAKKALLTFDELITTPINFSNFTMNRLKIDKLTKAHLVGPVYKLLKGTCQSSIELEYNIQECYKALSDQLDWNNPKGDRCPFDLSKPLPLKGHPGHLTVASEYFFNNDLEYLKSPDPEKQYTMSIMKTKAARYELLGIEDMIHNL